MVPYIACREDSWNISLSFVLRHNVSLLIEIDDSFEDLGVRLIAYSDEDAISCQRSRFSTLHILKSYSADLLISQNLSHLRIPSKLDSGIIHHSVLHDLARSEEHTSELQSHSDLVCRLLLEKKNLYKCISTYNIPSKK